MHTVIVVFTFLILRNNSSYGQTDKYSRHPRLTRNPYPIQQERAGSGQEPLELEEYESLPRHSETAGFLKFLKENAYDKRQRPVPHKEKHNPTVVHVSIFVGSIRSVSEITMDYSLEIFYREYWTDSRLNLDPARFVNLSQLSLHESYSEFLWRPDTFFPNAIESKNPQELSITHRSLLRLSPGGNILYSRRLSVTAECPMDLTLFPFDVQGYCRNIFFQWIYIFDGHPTNEIQYYWKGEEPVKYGNFRLPDFSLDKVIPVSRNYSYETGTYIRLKCCFVFKRSAGFCFLQLIIPATAVVITSWVCLWMENETTFQDMIAIILTITFLTFSYNTVMPRVSYIKAMDVYLGACFIFVFLSLIKLAMIKYMRQKMRVTRDQSLVAMSRREAGATLASSIRQSNGHATAQYSPILQSMDGDIQLGVGLNQQSFYRMHNFRKKVLYWKCMHAFHIITQMLFPAAFIVFALFYFIAYPRIYGTSETQTDDDICQ